METPNDKDDKGTEPAPEAGAAATPKATEAPGPPEAAEPPAAARPAEPPHIVHARRFWILSIVNWAIAIVCFGLSSYLGASRPTSMFVYTILFVVAIVAVIVGFLCWVVAKFGTAPEPRVDDAG